MQAIVQCGKYLHLLKKLKEGYYEECTEQRGHGKGKGGIGRTKSGGL